MLHVVSFGKKENPQCHLKITSHFESNVVSFISGLKSTQNIEHEIDTEREKAIQAINDRVNKLNW